MLTNSLLVLGVLCVNLAVSEWLCRKTFCRHFGTALLVILVTAIVANLGLIPTSPREAPVYDWLLGDVVRLAVFWILLQVNLRELLKAGAPMITMFIVGSAGTVIGVLTGMWAVQGAATFEGNDVGLAAMFAGTYTGGSINFNAMAAEYEVAKSGPLFAGSVVVDNIMTTIWMVVTIAVPRGIGLFRGRKLLQNDAKQSEQQQLPTGVEHDTETVHPVDLAILIALGAAAIGVANGLAWWCKEYFVDIPEMLFLTVIALVIAQTPLAAKLRGTRMLGMFAVYLFLAVIGALCDIQALGQLEIAVQLLVFVAIVVAVHGIVTFGIGALFKVDRDIVAIASQANIGGGTTAMAIARSLDRNDLVLPAILVGSLGTGLGNFLGILVAEVMKRM